MERRTRFIAALVICSTLTTAQTLPGDACLPRDVINLITGDLVAKASKTCKARENVHSAECAAECLASLYAFKKALCYNSLTQSQRLQPRYASIGLSGMAGIWYGLYPAGGVELLELTFDPSSGPGGTLRCTKLTGNSFVPAGKVSWEATPTGCKVVSSAYAGGYTPRWDPCTLFMQSHDQMSIDLGGNGADSETLHFVRAKTRLLLSWDAERADTYGLADAFDSCGVQMTDELSDIREWFEELVHHSSTHSVALDQLLAATPLVLLGGWWQLSREEQHRPILFGLASAWAMALMARLTYLGVQL